MDICTENANDIAKFFTLYNEILQKETGKEGYHFNPHYFMCDEGSANYCAIRQVYGENFTNARVVGCQWHFKNDVNRHSKDVSPDMRELFISLCHKLCACTTVAKYKILKSHLDDIGNMNPAIQRWDDRRSHIFTPYRGGGLPGLNVSEQGNAGWLTLSILTAYHPYVPCSFCAFAAISYNKTYVNKTSFIFKTTFIESH